MIIGIPRETWRDEKRVALTPAGVHTLVNTGHEVVVQSDAGAGCGFSQEDFENAGAMIAFSAEEAFSRADLVVKVMPPMIEECKWIPRDRILLSSVQLGVANPDAHRQLQKLRSTAIGYELIEDTNGNLPVLNSMSEIAGKMLPHIAGRLLESTYGGRGICLSGLAGIPASNVVIVGAGTVGSAAAHSFVGAGASVMVMDSNLDRLRPLESTLLCTINTSLATPYNLSRAAEFADVLIGAVLIHGQKAPHVITESMVMKMKHGSVLIDVSIDQGGCVETSRPTTLSDPTFVKHGVIHYCVPNIASSVARTASHALNNVLLPYVQDVADGGYSAFAEDLDIRRGLYLYRGEPVHTGLSVLFGQAKAEKIEGGTKDDGRK